MSLATDGSPYPVLLPASKIIKYSKLPDWDGCIFVFKWDFHQSTVAPMVTSEYYPERLQTKKKKICSIRLCWVYQNWNNVITTVFWHCPPVHFIIFFQSSLCISVPLPAPLGRTEQGNLVTLVSHGCPRNHSFPHICSLPRIHPITLKTFCLFSGNSLYPQILIVHTIYCEILKASFVRNSWCHDATSVGFFNTRIY